MYLVDQRAKDLLHNIVQKAFLKESQKYSKQDTLINTDLDILRLQRKMWNPSFQHI